MRHILGVLALTAVAHPAATASAQTTVAGDPSAREVTALAGTIVWVSGTPGQRQTLMQRSADGIDRVEGAPAARYYRSIDLGRDRDGDLVLTYLRCRSVSRCVARRDDLEGRRASFRGLELRRCSLSTAPAVWRTRAAYGLVCRTGEGFDERRSGVYVKTGDRTPRRMPRLREAAQAGATEVGSVELRGRQVASLVSDIYAYAVTQEVDGSDTRGFLAAASEGESDQRAVGLGLGSGGVLWSLTNAENADEPLRTVINRLSGICRRFQTLASPAGETTFRAIDLAVDGRTVYLSVPATGIVRHEFDSEVSCG